MNKDIVETKDKDDEINKVSHFCTTSLSPGINGIVNSRVIKYLSKEEAEKSLNDAAAWLMYSEHLKNI